MRYTTVHTWSAPPCASRRPPSSSATRRTVINIYSPSTSMVPWLFTRYRHYNRVYATGITNRTSSSIALVGMTSATDQTINSKNARLRKGESRDSKHETLKIRRWTDCYNSSGLETCVQAAATIGAGDKTTLVCIEQVRYALVVRPASG